MFNVIAKSEGLNNFFAQKSNKCHPLEFLLSIHQLFQDQTYKIRYEDNNNSPCYYVIISQSFKHFKEVPVSLFFSTLSQDKPFVVNLCVASTMC